MSCDMITIVHSTSPAFASDCLSEGVPQWAIHSQSQTHYLVSGRVWGVGHSLTDSDSMTDSEWR